MNSSRKKTRQATANLDNLIRIFTVPESEQSTLTKIESEISKNLIGFLNEHVVAGDIDPSALERDFSNTEIPIEPTFVSDQAQFLLEKIVAQSVHTASPRFIGHMTSCLPYFMMPLAKIMIALNQNLVKIETSKAFTPLERQVVGMLHRLVFDESEEFYSRWTQHRDSALGVFCSGGTIANVTALWAARNRLLNGNDGQPKASEVGITEALLARDLKGLAILCSKRGHYSLAKAVDVLGIGKKNAILVPTDSFQKINVAALRSEIATLRAQKIGIMSIVGIAGTTETGNIDPLSELANISEEIGCHFHVDAAWGGPTLFSGQHRNLLRGIERADSVTIDAHKQLYCPMGAGIALFRNPEFLSNIEHHSEYVIRRGSRDLGSHTLEGSRPGMAILVHSGLNIIGKKGYELLIDLGISRAKQFAKMIAENENFELISAPELNLLTYRFVPKAIKLRLESELEARNRDWVEQANKVLSELVIAMQKLQRDRGQSFVSRTRLEIAKYEFERLNVFRVVLANPLTTKQILSEILDEQKSLGGEILAQPNFKNLIEKLLNLPE